MVLFAGVRRHPRSLVGPRLPLPRRTHGPRLYHPDHLRVERGVYTITGVDPDNEQFWQAYLRSVLAFSFFGALVLYLLQRIQHILPFTYGNDNVEPKVAFNTAISFVTNTNWQAYSGETFSYSVQAAGLAVQNFVSAATGIAAAVALTRGFA